MSYLDILSIDVKIKKAFEEEKDRLSVYTEKLQDLEKTLNTQDIEKKLTSRIYKNLVSNVEDIKEKINEIYTQDKLNFYISSTVHLLEKYKNILQTPIKLTFIGINGVNDIEKNNLISKYLEIAQEYTNIEFNTPNVVEEKVICNNCYNKKLFDVIDSSIYICLVCGSQQEILLHTSSYKDIDRVNISAKYAYDRKLHFRDCINQYQGKQNTNINSKIFNDLINQFEKHHLLVGNKNLSREKRCVKITKEHIYLFLKELEYTKHYENVNLIHYQITGSKPDDISYLEDKLLDDFDILTNLYDKKFKNKAGFSRKNFINTQYILYQLLLKYKHPCKKEDFTILKTVDRKSFHDDITKMLFEELGWNMSPLF
jgi:hypothetical protein